MVSEMARSSHSGDGENVPANDNGDRDAVLDPRIISIARAIGSWMARERAQAPSAVNDNDTNHLS
jgi:hypothetical protein